MTPGVCFRLWFVRLCQVEAGALERGHGSWPPPDLSPEQRAEVAHLEQLGAEAGRDAEELAGARTRRQRNRLWQAAQAALCGPAAGSATVPTMAAKKDRSSGSVVKSSGSARSAAQAAEGGRPRVTLALLSEVDALIDDLAAELKLPRAGVVSVAIRRLARDRNKADVAQDVADHLEHEEQLRRQAVERRKEAGWFAGPSNAADKKK